jgi:hypothetical protein
MGFFEKHKPAADGKTAEEQSEAQMTALVERLGASLEERIAKPLREDLTALKTEWETIKAEATKPPAAAGPTDESGKPRELTDEEKRNNATRATITLAVTTNARLTEREIIDELPADWSHLTPDIRALFANTPIERKAQPDYADYCRNCADLVIAKAARKAGLRYDQGNKTFFLEDKSAAGASGQDSPLSDPSLVWNQTKGDGSVKRWTAEEQLRKLGIDPKEFAANVEKGVV